MYKLLLSSIAALALSTASMAYDVENAEKFNRFFSGFNQKACADSKLFIQADDVMNMLRNAEKFTLLDIRTPGETGVVSLATDNTVAIPLEHLFEKSSLEAIPKERPVVIVCYSGTRASMAAVGLLQSGIRNIHVLKGGIVAPAAANSVKNAPLKGNK